MNSQYFEEDKECFRKKGRNIKSIMIESFSIITQILCDKYNMEPEEAFLSVINSSIPETFRYMPLMFLNEPNELWAQKVYEQFARQHKDNSELILTPDK